MYKFCNGAQLFGEKNECTSNLNIIDNFEAQVGNDKYIYINRRRKERETQESGREIGKTKRFNQTNSNLKVIRASLFSKGRFAQFLAEEKEQGARKMVDDRSGVGTDHRARAGCGRSCLADAPNSVGRADVKQTTGN